MLIGHGQVAKGSITPLPGAGGRIPGLDASLGSDGFMDGGAGSLVGVAACLALGYFVGRHLFSERT